MLRFATFIVGVCLLAPAHTGAAETFRDGDRVVLVGDTLIEREQESGWLETVLATAFPSCRLTVRNLGWSADTPAGASRASFDFAEPAKGFYQLTNEIALAKPTVVMVGYGMASSFDGEDGVAKFISDMNRLLDAITRNATNPVRFIILSPLRHEELPSPMPGAVGHNEKLRLYTDALRQIAAERGDAFVDLFDWHPTGRLTDITDDGIHLTPEGYRLMAEEIGRQLRWSENWKQTPSRTLEELRDTIIRKDQLFFDRWRPENQTYLLGFRSHEQGQNAREIPEFDPLIEAAENRIIYLQALARGHRNPPPLAPTSTSAPTNAAPLPLPQFTVAPGFEIQLWAQTPLLAKPTQINFDPQGRLWVAESSIYPQIAPGQQPNDKIVILEDSHNRGHADKSTIFADGLFIPTAVEPGDGGCYVGQSTELLHFTAEPGGKVRRDVVLSGFGTEDTHHMVHTLTWGPDGMLYFDQSIYIHTYIETPHGVVRLNSGGVFHLRPLTGQLDVFLRGFCNPWGHQFDSFGQSFVTDGAGYQGISWGIPGATYFTYAQMRRELPSISPGSYPKFCGLEIISSPQFPDDWQGNMVTADFRAHRLARFAVEEDGAGYVTKQMPDLLTTTNDTFRPIDLKMGYDGALYIADWCNPIINHGEVDFRDPRRDHNHGRIWRITAMGRPLARRHDWTRADDKELLDALVSSNAFDVRAARRGLTERGPSILPALKKWAGRQISESALLQALWMYQSIDIHNDALLDRLLEARDGRIRAAAVRVLSAWPRTHFDGAHLEPDYCYRRALADPFPRVRVEALRAIARIPTLRSATWALETWRPHMDPFVNYALWLTINDLAKPFLEGLRSGEWNSNNHLDYLNYCIDAIDPALAEPTLHELLKSQPLTRDGQGPWFELIGRDGDAKEAQRVWEKIDGQQLNTNTEVRAWQALSAAAARGVNPVGGQENLAPFFDSPTPAIRAAAVKLAGKWKVGGSGLLKLAAAPDLDSSLRSDVFNSLRQIGGPETIAALLPLSAPTTSLDIRRQAIFTLASLDAASATAPAIQLLTNAPDEKSAVADWQALLGVTGEASLLAEALPRQGFPSLAGKAGVRAIHESGREEPELVIALTRASGLQGAEAELTKGELTRLAAEVKKSGDPARGERIFRRATQSCAGCHSIGGVGGHVGPDLTSLGASAPVDYLIDSVYYPNKEIKEGFASLIIETKDGEDISGIPVRENDRDLVLRNASGQDVTIAKTDILHKKIGSSLMPSGLTDNLSHQEQLDLFRFLSQLGKPGPFDASKGNVARAWKVTAHPAAPDWHPVTSLVNGDLLSSDIRTSAGPGQTYQVATQFRSVQSGPVHFALTAPGSETLSIDGHPTPLADGKVTTDLAAGLHAIALELDASNPPPVIRIQSDDGTFLAP